LRRAARRSSPYAYPSGVTSRLGSFEIGTPPIAVIAIGWRKLGSAPRQSAIGTAIVIVGIGSAVFATSRDCVVDGFD
jgi:hypothetical protein